MNHWAFILPAYALVIVATAALIFASLAGMRRAEAQADALRNRR